MVNAVAEVVIGCSLYVAHSLTAGTPGPHRESRKLLRAWRTRPRAGETTSMSLFATKSVADVLAQSSLKAGNII